MTYWRTPRVTRPATIGGNPSPASHYSAGGTRADLNSFAGVPPRQSDLAVVRGSPFIPERKLHPVEPLDLGFDHREFAVYVFLSCFGVSVGVLLAAATALLDWSF